MPRVPLLRPGIELPISPRAGPERFDFHGSFNSSLEGNLRRAIDFHEGDKVNEKALKALIRAAVALNTSKG